MGWRAGKGIRSNTARMRVELTASVGQPTPAGYKSPVFALFSVSSIGIVFASRVGATSRGGAKKTMSPRNFWNHPLHELARSLVHTFGPDDAGQLTTDEFTAFLGRLVGTTAQGPGLMPQAVSRLADNSTVERMQPKSL
jgi:hypothetical protein